jgi:uncharacterized membrane protein
MEETIQFFGEYKKLATIIHVFAVIIGMGSALVSDILFNVYIKDKKINPTENSTLEVLSRIIWISLGAIFLSGIAIFLSNPPVYSASDKFLLKMVIVGFVIINGYLFARVTHGSLSKINFTDTNSNHKYVRIRRLSFAFGAVSLVSWLSAFILGSISSIPVSFWSGLMIYGVLLLIGITGSQVVEYMITHPKK